MPSIAEQIAEYEQGPALLRQAVAGMGREQMLARPVAGKMSALEVVAHIADFEPVHADRMKRVAVLDEPTLAAADENRFLAGLRYQDRDAEDELRLIELTRKQMARILKALPAEAFCRAGVHSERGPLTLARLLEIATGHIRHHVPFIAEKRKALGL